jgi:hypothetical protein
MDATNLRLKAMHGQMSAASHRIDQSIREMLSLLEDEIADGEYEAIQRAARARVASLESDDRW